MPDWKQLVHRRLTPLRMEATAEADLTEELAQHLDDLYRDLTSGGASDEEAYKQVIAELDDLYPLRAGLDQSQRMPKYESVPAGDVRPGNLLDDLWRDLRYAVRTMRKSPLFVLFVVLTLSLGIGANSTVFTLINTLILNPLPVPNVGELHAVTNAQPANVAKSGPPLPLSYADLKDYERGNGAFQSLGAYTSPRQVTLQTGSSSERMFCELVTAAYFPALAIRPAQGRFFLPDEDTTPGAHPVAVMNYGTWQARYGGAADILGKTVVLNTTTFTIVGVAPPQFIGLNSIFGPDLWIPSAMAETLLPNEMKGVLIDRSKMIFSGIGRLKPGITRSQAQANFTTLASALAHDHPETNEGHTVTVVPVRDVMFASTNSGSTSIVTGSMVLLIVVGIVLLIACSNVANLLLARSASRQQEIAVRLAMGASRPRLVRQLLTESMLLGVLSGAVGLLVAYAALRLLWSSLPAAANFIAPKFDGLVFAFALAVSLATGLIFGAAPAFKAARGSLAEALKEEARTAGRSRGKVSLAHALLVGQVALSFLLLVTAALFLRSIGRAYNMDPGFQTKHLLVLMTNPGQVGYGKAQAKAFYREVRERVARMPGVASVSWSGSMPLWSRSVTPLTVEGHQVRSNSEKPTTVVHVVDRGFFETAGVAIDSGRAFSELDREESTPVVIVNEKLAQDYWPGGTAIGKRIQLAQEKQMRQIVGVARNANYTTLGEPPQLSVYLPLEQRFSDAMNLYVRSTGDPAQILAPIRRETESAGVKIVVSSGRTGPEFIDNGLFQPKMGVALLTAFGLLALGLASIGLYGIMAYSVSQRQREIGLRMALGAAQGSVLRLILRQGMTLVLVGLGIGFAGALIVGRLLSRMLYGVSASDPVSVAGAVVVLLGVGLLACYLPARWASRVDPLVALREG